MLSASRLPFCQNILSASVCLRSMSSNLPSQRRKISSGHPGDPRGARRFGGVGRGRGQQNAAIHLESENTLSSSLDATAPGNQMNTINAASNRFGDSRQGKRPGGGGRGRGLQNTNVTLSSEKDATALQNQRSTIIASSIPKPEGVMAQTQAEQRSGSPKTNDRHFSEKRFADAPISQQSKAGLKYEFLTDVQAATLEPALSGKDLLVQARTGTGKTIAFLLPAIERLLNVPRRGGISILVLSPTRELALQIEKEAETLISHHQFKVQHAIGGTNQSTESRRLLQSPCDILIATPGRLLDHLRSSELPQRFSQLKTVVYDEADRLLDQGFSRDLEAINSFLPPKGTRQALLFSATVSNEIKKIAAGVLRPGYSFITTLLEDEVNTHEHVEQTYILTPQGNFLQATIDILKQDLQANPQSSKCMVFFPTARQVSLAAEVLSQIPGLPPILEIHSRKSQAARTKAAESFKGAKSAVLLSSDVAARGVDFPGVTLVLQVGMPASGEQYIHRLGRTARAGAAGRGILLLSPEEEFFLRKPEVAALGIQKAQIPASTSTANSLPLSKALDRVSKENKGQAYRAFLGYYNTYAKQLRMSKEQLVEFAWMYAVHALGWPEASDRPPIEPKVVGKMNLKGVKGLNIQRKVVASTSPR